MKRWTNLGFVDTIYEEEDYIDHSSSFSSSSSSLSHSPQRRINLSSPSMELESRVHKWSLANNSKPDVFVNVGNTRFHLHKDPLSTRSGYLKRHLTAVNELTLSPPLNITAETFSLIAGFCYGAHIELTPFNVVSLRVAVEILLMNETGVRDDGGRESLRNMTESYLRRVVFVSADFIQIVLRSCIVQLPESETSAFLIGRCIEALTEIGDSDSVNEFLKEAVGLPAGDFLVVADAVQERFPRHDLLYRIVDAYVKDHNGEITEEEKVQICNSIDCDKLSPPILLHAVQNPKMPLRFIVRAMLQEQLNTRHSIMAAAASAAPAVHRHREVSSAAARDSSVTLGSLLQRDTAARQNCRLRAAMNSTSSRIESLEKELDAMRKFISKESEKQTSDRITTESSRSRSVMDSARSASFHCVNQQRQSNINKTQRGDRGSVSNLSTTYRRRRASPPPPPQQTQKSLGKRLIKGLKSAFSSSSKQGAKKNSFEVEEIYDGLEDFVWIKDDDDDNISEELHSHYINNK